MTAAAILAVGFVLALLLLAISGQLTILTKQVDTSGTSIVRMMAEGTFGIGLNIRTAEAHHAATLERIAELYRPIVVVLHGPMKDEIDLAAGIRNALANPTKH